MILKIVNLKKGYFKKRVLDGFELELKKGQIYGFVGPNGSGKSTFMKIVAGLVQKSGGTLYFDGKEFNNQTRYNIAYQPTEDFFYPWMKVKEVLTFYRDFYNDFDNEKALQFLTEMDLDLNEKVSSLSTGQKGRLKVLLVLCRNVKLYMLDEPLNGLDPVSRDKILLMISKEINENKTMLISSHLINEFEPILNRIIFLKEGIVFLDEECEALRSTTQLSLHDYYKTIYE